MCSTPPVMQELLEYDATIANLCAEKSKMQFTIATLECAVRSSRISATTREKSLNKLLENNRRFVEENSSMRVRENQHRDRQNNYSKLHAEFIQLSSRYQEVIIEVQYLYGVVDDLKREIHASSPPPPPPPFDRTDISATDKTPAACHHPHLA